MTYQGSWKAKENEANLERGGYGWVWAVLSSYLHIYVMHIIKLLLFVHIIHIQEMYIWIYFIYVYMFVYSFHMYSLLFKHICMCVFVCL